ncbi:hypothetical protein [Adhaeribacter soli]|uniref:LemA family protein n=1 Tax=Adhaeribacter soli TaxID=2607655 RepID=A0A5N1IRW1_9BACT|nr:hypothetical protein [Adhaeribacter soli]KAA9332651.1 hypothetical protein F0P94_11615 [Adhaeribacter soli]
MKRILVIFSIAALAGIYSCKTDKTKTTEVKKERVIAKKTDAQVKADLDSLSREMDRTWNEMIASDDQKIDNLQTLLARIGRDKNYDKAALTKVISARDSMKQQRYDRQGLANVAAVDAYDSLQIKIMDATNELVQNTNLAERDTVAASLVNQIQEDDSRVPILRAYYDKAAKHFNQYLKDYQPQIQKLGPPYSDLKPVPMFVEQPVM